MSNRHVLRQSPAAVNEATILQLLKNLRKTLKNFCSDLSGPKATIEHLIVKSDNRQLHCIHVDKILYKCFLIDTGGASLYLGVAPNSTETF